MFHRGSGHCGSLPEKGALMLHGSRAVAESLVTLRYKKLMNENRLDPAAEGRRQEVLAMLVKEPNIQYAITSNDESESDAMIVTLAIRGKGTCELRIPKDRYDGLALLQLVDERTGGRD
jgi:hypothetical protein